MSGQPPLSLLRVVLLIASGIAHHLASTIPTEADKVQETDENRLDHTKQHDKHPSAVRPFLLCLKLSKVFKS